MHCIRRAASRPVQTPSSWALASLSSRTTPLPLFTQRLSQCRWKHDKNEIDKGLPTPVRHDLKGGFLATHDGTPKKRDPPPEPQSDDVKRAIIESSREKHDRQKRLALLSDAPEPKETVFVGNLFYDVKAEDLRKQMEKYGTVYRAILVYNNKGVSRGYGYVQFEKTEEAQRAIESLDGQIFEGRYTTVQFARNNLDRHRKMLPVSRMLYIGNLAFEMTDRDLNDLFKDIWNVIDVRVSIDRRTGQTRGFAHAEFTTPEAARKAAEVLSKKAPFGRKLQISFSDTNKKAEKLGKDADFVPKA